MSDFEEFSILVASGANFPDALVGAVENKVAAHKATIFLTTLQPEKITQKSFYSLYDSNPENKTIYIHTKCTMPFSISEYLLQSVFQLNRQNRIKS